MSQIMYLQKMPIHPHGRDWKFLGVGGGGVQRSNNFKEIHEVLNRTSLWGWGS